MGRPEDKINKQKFEGIMDVSSDMTVFRQGKHRSSQNLRAISSNKDQFIFSSIEGTINRVGLKEGYKHVGWVTYENSIYILSKPWQEAIEFLYIQKSDRYVDIIFDNESGLNVTVGENIYFELYSQYDYDFEKSNGIFKVTQVYSSNSIQIDLLNKSFNSVSFGPESGKGIVEPLKRGEIGEIKVDRKTGDLSYTPLYNHKDLPLSFTKYISREGITINKENNRTLRMYFTDYASEPKSFNLRKSIFNKHIDNGNLLVSKQYMVLNGNIVHDGVSYSTNGSDVNIFTAVNTNYTGTGIVIEYYPVELLKWNPDWAPGSFEFIGTRIGGQIPVGTYSVVYRMTDSEGAKTSWSLSTNPIYLGKGAVIPTIENYWAKQGSISNENSGQKMLFEFKELDQRWNKIQIALIKHLGKDTFQNPVLIYDEEFSSDSLVVEYDGTSNTTSFNLGDINQFNRYFKKVMTIESIKNILFASNFESGSVLNKYKDLSVHIDKFTYKCISDEVVSNAFVNPDAAVKPITDIDGSVLKFFPYPLTGHSSRYGAGNYLYSDVWYQSDDGICIVGETTPITYKKDQIFKVDNSQKQKVISTGSTTTIIPLIMIRKFQETIVNDIANDLIKGDVYKLIFGSVLGYDVDDIFEYKGQPITFTPGSILSSLNYKKIQNTGYLDGNNELIQEKLSSFPRSEKAIVGIVLVDLKGNKLPPRKIGEIYLPSINNSPLSGAETSKSKNDAYIAHLNHLGLKIGDDSQPIDLLDIIDEISGFHIVIAPIKRKKKAQGLMFRTQRHNCEDPVRISAEFGTRLIEDGYKEYFDTPGNECGTVYANGYDKAKVLYSPDVMFQSAEELNFQTNDKIRIEQYLFDEQSDTFANNYAYYAPNLGKNFIYGTPYTDIYSSKTIPSGIFLKYQKPSIDQSSSRSPIGSTLTIKDLSKVTETGVTDVPNSPNTLYNTDTLSRRLNDAPFTSHVLSSNVKNHLVLGHDSEEFGLFENFIPDGVLVSLISSNEPNYGSEEFIEYVSVGHYQPLTDSVKKMTSGIFKEIEIFGGETFLSFYTQRKNEQRQTYGNPFGYYDDNVDIPGFSLIITFPCESIINTYRRTFVHAAKDREKIDPAIPESFVVDRSNQYLGTLIKYAALIDIDYENTLFEKSTAYSRTKILGERYDSWREFLYGNYKTAESQVERIVASKRSDQYLVLWHEKGMSYYPVGDRAAITDNQGGSIRIGYGGIMDVNIPTSFTEGLQDRKALVETPTHYVWLCKRSKNILQIPKKGIPQMLNEKNFLDSYLEDYLPDGAAIREKDNPYYGAGIIGGYNPKFKEVLFSFLKTDRDSRKNLFIAKENFNTLIIDALNLVPTGKYKFVADDYIWIDSWMYSSIPMPLQAKVLNGYDNQINYLDKDIYIAINPIILSDLSEIENPAFFTKIGNIGNLHQHNVGTKCKFYGVMTNPEFTVVFNLPIELFKRFDSHQLRVNHGPGKVNFKTNVGLSVTDQSTFKLRDYSFINSLPFTSTKARLRGHAIEIEYIWNVYDEDITIPNEKIDLLLHQIDLYFDFINQK